MSHLVCAQDHEERKGEEQTRRKRCTVAAKEKKCSHTGRRQCRQTEQKRTLTNLARLHGETPADDSALAAWANRTIDMPEALVRDVLSLTDAPHRSAALVNKMPEYLGACERLWAFTDNWRASAGASGPGDTTR